MLCTVVGLGMSLASLATAEETRRPPVLKVGPGFVLSGKPYKGYDEDIFPIGMVFYESPTWSFRGTEVGYRLFDTESLDFKAIARWRFDGYDDDESSALTGMDRRHMTVDGGASLAWSGDWGALTASFVNDLLGRHDGRELRFAYSKRFALGDLSLTPSVGMRWQSDNLVRYYYGVETDEVRAGRPRYRPKEAINPYAGVSLSYDLEGPWSLYGALQYEWLASEITDSPIIEDHHRLSVLAGLLYEF